MEDAMNIIMLYQNDSIERVVRPLLEMEGYTVTSTEDPAEALRLIEASAGPFVTLADNLKINPAGVEALRSLRTNPTLMKRVRVIGFDIASVREMEISWGILDDFVAMGLKDLTLLDTIEANFAKLSAQ